jgi:hypothetical protein
MTIIYSTKDEEKKHGFFKGWHKQINGMQHFPFIEVKKNNKVVGCAKRLKFGDEGDNWGGKDGRCHDCGAKVGQFHTNNCDVEREPLNGVGQLLGSEDYGDYLKRCSKNKLMKVM